MRDTSKNTMPTLSHIIWTLLQPGHLLLLLLVGGGVMTLFAGTRKLGLWFSGTATLTLVILALFPIGTLLLRPLENRFPEPQLFEHIDGIIVLGGGQNMKVTQARGHITFNGSGERMIEAVALSRRFPGARIVFTGGNGSSGLTEADVARMTFEELGLGPDRVVFEDQAANTYDNAIVTFDALNPEPGEIWLLVTSAWHMPRSVGVFRKAGWDVIPYPVDFRTAPEGTGLFGVGLDGNLRDFTLALHEYLGLAAYRLMDRTDVLFPGPEQDSDQL